MVTRAPIWPWKIHVEYKTFPDLELVPVEKQEMIVPEVAYNFFALFSSYNNGLRLISIDNVTYMKPLVSTLFTALSEGNDLMEKEELYGPTSGATVLNLLKLFKVPFRIKSPDTTLSIFTATISKLCTGAIMCSPQFRRSIRSSISRN